MAVSCAAPTATPTESGAQPEEDGAATPAVEETDEPEANPSMGCADFDDLESGDEYHVGDTFTTSGVRITTAVFQLEDGNWTSSDSGFVEVQSGDQTGGSGQEIRVSNILLNFDFGGTLSDLTLQFGEYGGNLNIEINGEFVNFENFEDLNGTTIAGVDSTVVNGLGEDRGTLTLAGPIDTFAVGGQELWIDDVCPPSDLGVDANEDCPDPAVVSLSAEILSHSPEWPDTQGEVAIVGMVRNVGGAAFESSPRQQELVLYQGDSTSDLEPVQRKTFQNLAPGEEVRIIYRRDWDAASPAEGEFPPIYSLWILYDPDIAIDGSESNDDCNLDNNAREMDGDEINRLFTE